MDSDGRTGERGVRSGAQELRGKSRAGLKILIPGYVQWTWRQRERAAVIFGSFAMAMGWEFFLGHMAELGPLGLCVWNACGLGRRYPSAERVPGLRALDAPPFGLGRVGAGGLRPRRLGGDSGGLAGDGRCLGKGRLPSKLLGVSGPSAARRRLGLAPVLSLGRHPCGTCGRTGRAGSGMVSKSTPRGWATRSARRRAPVKLDTR